MVQSVLAQVAREAIIGVDDKLHRLACDDSKGVGFEEADLGDPNEAVLAGDHTVRSLSQRDLRAAVGQRLEGGLVINGAVPHPRRAKEAVSAPHGGDEREDNNESVLEHGLMVGRTDEGHDEEHNV